MSPHADAPNILVATLWVGLGGALGAAARYLVTLLAAMWWPGLPLGTFAANTLGCLLIGVFAGLADVLDAPWRLFLMTGICGGFTTYSAIVFELVSIGREQDWWMSVLYMAMTLLAGLAAFVLGLWLGGLRG